MIAAALAFGGASCGRHDPPGAAASGEAGEAGEAPGAGEPAAASAAPEEGAAPKPPSPAAAAAQARPMGPQATLSVITMQPQVYAAPSGRERRIGYLRRGAKVPGEARPTPGEGCAEGWYRLAPYGFVCGRNVTLDANHPEARARTPNLDDPLPYPY
ncbi:MAG TPA: hypothetical protein VFS43_45330, partial [Polyangiaceae bacterium]|nr:hypothetical protein [Polyangiaceae bacterium]